MTFSFRAVSRSAPAAAALASALAYPFLPSRVATHFDEEGQPDRYGSRLGAALSLPAMMLALTVVDECLGAWPGAHDREDSESGVRARNEAMGLVQVALLQTHLALLSRGVGVPLDIDRVSRGVYGVLMVALGNVMPRLPRNSLVGIRTPWTLLDPTVWERTHRLGGYLVMAAGFVSLASLPGTGKRPARLSLAALLGAVGLATAYSFVAYIRRPRVSE